MKRAIPKKLLAAVLAAVLTLSACSETNSNVKSHSHDEEEEEDVTEKTERIKHTTSAPSEEEPEEETSAAESDAAETAADTTTSAAEAPAPIIAPILPAAAFNTNGQMYMKKNKGLPYFNYSTRSTYYCYFFKGNEIYKSFTSTEYIDIETNYIGTTVVRCGDELWLINSDRCEMIDKGDIASYPQIASMADVLLYMKGNSLCCYDGSVSVIREAGFMTYEGDGSKFENMDLGDIEPDTEEYYAHYSEIEEKSLYEGGIKSPDIYGLTVSPDGSAFAWIGNATFHIGGGEGGSVRYRTGKLYACRKGENVKYFDTPTNIIYSISNSGDMICTLDGDSVLAGTFGMLYAFRDMSEKPIALGELNGGDIMGVSADGSTIAYALLSGYQAGHVEAQVFTFGKNANTPIFLTNNIVYNEVMVRTLYTPKDSFYARSDLDTFLANDLYSSIALYTRKGGTYDRKELLTKDNHINHVDVVISDDSQWILGTDENKDLLQIRTDGSGESITIARNVNSFLCSDDFSKIYYISNDDSTKNYIYMYSAEDNSTRLIKAAGSDENYYLRDTLGDILVFERYYNRESTYYFSENGGEPYADTRFRNITFTNNAAFAKDYYDQYYISYDLKEFTPTGIYGD